MVVAGMVGNNNNNSSNGGEHHHGHNHHHHHGHHHGHHQGHGHNSPLPVFRLPPKDSPIWSLSLTNVADCTTINDSSTDAMDVKGDLLDLHLSFVPLAKMERLGRLADWTGQSGAGAGGSHNLDYGQRRIRGAGAASTQPLYAKNEEDEEGWSLSSMAAATSVPSSGAAGKQRSNIGTGGSGASGASGQMVLLRPPPPPPPPSSSSSHNASGGGGPSHSRTKAALNGPRRGSWQPRSHNGRGPASSSAPPREASIQVPVGWRVIEEIEFGRLAKLQLDPDEPTILQAGSSGRLYDRAWEKTSTRMERPLQQHPNQLNKDEATTAPATIANLSDQSTTTVITTDSVASLLMACTRTVAPWDLVIERTEAGVIRLDRRPGSLVDAVQVNETAADPPNPDDTSANGMNALAQEASQINRDLIQQVSKDVLATSTTADPRLSAWDLGNGIRLVIRGDLHASARAIGTGEEQEVHLRALLECHDTSTATSATSGNKFTNQTSSSSLHSSSTSSMDWRQRLDTQRGAVLAYEIKNNNAQMARWCYQAILSSISAIKLAFVSRQAPRDRTRHHLLGLMDLDPHDLAVQMSLNVPGGFGILRAIVEQCRGLPEGRYCLLRDPNKPLLRLYAQQ